VTVPMGIEATPFPGTCELDPLSLCRTILEKQHIHFSVENGAEGGRRFEIRLPGEKEDI
jgi:hypothetical protein